ncbi:MAG: FHA domain-containing protein [Anaerolineales bacterium]|nr:FHA domain-containing protein [Anaerolineales bacterium]
MNRSGDFKLIIREDAVSPKEFELTRPEIIIGRDPNVDLTFPSPAVSRRHARLTRDGEGYLLEDLGSSNGTYLNGDRLVEQRKLKTGDQIRLGQAITLTYEAPATVEVQQTVASSVLAMPDKNLQTVLEEDIDISQMDAAGPPKLLVNVAGGSSKTYTLTRPVLTIGRVEDNDIVIPSQIVSGQHARLEQMNGGYQLTVLPQARNPVLFEGRPVEGAQVLHHGDILRIGSLDPGMMVTLTYQAPREAATEPARDIVFGEKTLIQVGRDPSNDVALASPTVSRYHAQFERVGQRYRIVDLRSSNGTFVNDERIEKETWLKPMDTIRIGQYRFVMGTNQLAQFDESSGLRVEAIHLNKWVRKDLNILKDISVVIKPREFIVVVGQSGGGKSTLVDAIAGYRPATHGNVLVNNTDIYRHFDVIRNDIGFVPQKDIIHMELTVYQALDYAAQLRMPSDTTPEERHKRVMEVLQDLDLEHRKDVQISGLSGGQQKRVSIGVELLTKPGLFFLDEPTSGLDPGTETALMQLMRRLADQGRTIVLITHATKNVMLGDKVIFLARGGYLAWFGPPEEALEYFDQYRPERNRRAGAMEFDEIYAVLDDSSKGSPEEWAKRYRENVAYKKYVEEPLEGKMSLGAAAPAQEPKQVDRKVERPASQQVSGLRQFLILSARNIKILTRDRFGLALMLATAPIVSLLDVILSVLLGRNPLDFNTGLFANVMITLFLLTVYGVMVGGISQMREIVKEAEIYKRERLVNLKILPYVLSKVWVAALLALYQAAAYTLVHYLAFEVPGGVSEFFQIYITLTLATLAGMMLGLFASALAPNSNSAPLLVIILMLPQIVLGGALIPLPSFISAPTSTRWAFEALMSISGAGSDVAADVCWALPPDVREAMTPDDKLNYGCRCMGVKMLEPGSCDYPGLGQFYNPAIAEPPPVEPPPFGEPPLEPVLPERPVEPVNQSDSVAMADFFTALQAWEAQATQIQEDYKRQIEAYQAQSEVYKSEVIAYQTELVNWQIAQASAVTPAEAVVNQFYTNFDWIFVNKEDSQAYWAKIVKTWSVQSGIILTLFVAILFLQKRKDIT